jgi:hypothetical protein
MRQAPRVRIVPESPARQAPDAPNRNPRSACLEIVVFFVKPHLTKIVKVVILPEPDKMPG